MQCAPGTYAGNAVEPCLPCPVGTYQPESGQIACLPCPGQQSTHGTGASSVDLCGGNTSPYCFFLIIKPNGTSCLLSTVSFELNIPVTIAELGFFVAVTSFSYRVKK